MRIKGLTRAIPLFFATVLCLTLCVSCGVKKAQQKAPELPAKHWLEESPGIPAQQKYNLDASVNKLAEAKPFDFEECVFLAIQQSPLLVKSAVDIELKRLKLIDTVWQYIPEPKVRVNLANNITRYNGSNRDKPKKYGQTAFDYEIYGAFNNPVITYFEHKVQAALINAAISLHRKAVGEIIYKIAQSYLKLQLYEDIIKKRRQLRDESQKLVSYWQQVENVEGEQGSNLNLALQHRKELELELERAQRIADIERSTLKMLIGLDAKEELKLNLNTMLPILKDFDGEKFEWADRWTKTEDELLLRGQVTLEDYKILVAWAQYLPLLTIQANKNPPAGHRTPTGGTPDYFLHFDFDIPLFDYGHRYRGVQVARMKKAEAFHDIAQKRNEYSYKWLQARQGVTLAGTKKNLAKTRLETAQVQFGEARADFENGIVEMPEYVSRQENRTDAEIAFSEAQLNYNLANLEWMYVAARLQEYFLGLPAKNLEE